MWPWFPFPMVAASMAEKVNEACGCVCTLSLINPYGDNDGVSVVIRMLSVSCGWG